MDAIELSLFASRISAICEEMGAVLKRSAFSPNIRDRLDFSCAIFDADGALLEQAAAIPVHLGSMAFAMSDVVSRVAWRQGVQLVLNDPFQGGTHLPDVTLVAPIWRDDQLIGFAANRAHHADIGCESPGSMPMSRHIDEEGLLIPPTLLDLDASDPLADLVRPLSRPDLSRGDLWAQISANQTGVRRVLELVARCGRGGWRERVTGLNDYAEGLSRAAIKRIPDGVYRFSDQLDGDPTPSGQEGTPQSIPLEVAVTICGDSASVDFEGSASQVDNNLNCPLSVTAAGVHFVFRCLMDANAPQCAGAMRPIRIEAPLGSLLNAQPPAAVAAGNVETSMRVVDLVSGALAGALPDRIPAAGQGTMNNVAMGARGAGAESWDYYETLAGGAGGHPAHPGASAVHTHMTNTLNTPIEVLEYSYPLRVLRYALRTDSGGAGRHAGGQGLVREYCFLAPAAVSLMTERRHSGPWGVQGGDPGRCGENLLNDQALPGRCGLLVACGDRLTVKTPGGGGWGDPGE